MRVSKFVLYLLFTFTLGINHSFASFVSARATEPARRAASPVPFITTVFYTTEDPQKRAITERNLLLFEDRNREDLRILEDQGFFEDMPVRRLSQSAIAQIKSAIYRISQSQTNIAIEFCKTPAELIRDFRRYCDRVWDEPEHYAVQEFETLEALKMSLSDLGKILNFARGNWKQGRDES